MELTRRDAVAALGALGVAGGAAALSQSDDRDGKTDERATTPTESDDDGASLSDHDLATAVAVAESIYPSAVENVEGFVTDFLRGRVADDPARATDIGETVDYLDGYVSTWYDVDAFVSLPPETRTEVFSDMNADTVDPEPDGGDEIGRASCRERVYTKV